MPGHKWTPEMKAKLAETMRQKHAAKAGGKTPTKKAAPKAAAAKKAPAKKPVANAQKLPKKALATALLEGKAAAISSPWKLRELREHAQALAGIASIPGLNMDIVAKVNGELAATIEILKEERQETYGLSSFEQEIEAKKTAERRQAEEQRKAAEKPAPAPTSAPAPVEAKAFTPANVGEFRGTPNGTITPPAPPANPA